jgi:predicted MFS family arabinose efflux permease
LFANAALHRSGIPAALVALGMTVAGLSAVNVSDALASVLEGRSTFAYWLQTGLIAGYFVWLLVLHMTSDADAKDSQQRRG